MLRATKLRFRPKREGSNQLVSRDKLRISKASTALSGIAAVFFVVTLVVGINTWWHPLPFWDMWNGYLGFWYSYADGELSAWWNQHNEHRILLAKFCFWLDFSIFGGSGVFLIVCINASIVAIIFILLYNLHERLGEPRTRSGSKNGLWLITFTIIIICAAWMQRENLLWGFQIQFTLACLLGLSCFTALAKASREPLNRRNRRNIWVFVAVGSAILSPWTIASGLLVPFLAASLSWFLKLPRQVSFILLTIAVASFSIYQIGYVTPTGHSQPFESIISNPLDIVRYLTSYLGGPVWWATDSRWLTYLAGALLIVASGIAAWKLFRNPNRSPIALASLTFIVYVIMWAAASAVGRINLGADQSLAGRYQTPVLIAWACLLIISAPFLQSEIERNSIFVPITLLSIPVVLLPQQISAIDTDPSPLLHARDSATLALAMDIPDVEVISTVFPSIDLPMELALRAKRDGLTVLGQEPYRSMSEGIQTPWLPSQLTHCKGWIDSVQPIAHSPYSRISGWTVTGSKANDGPLTIVNKDNVVVGYLTYGSQRPDVADAIPGSPVGSGFTGYVMNSSDNGQLFVAGNEWQCENPLNQ